MIVTDAAGIIRIISYYGEAVSIIQIESIFRGEPQQTSGILHNADDNTLGKSLLDGYLLKFQCRLAPGGSGECKVKVKERRTIQNDDFRAILSRGNPLRRGMDEIIAGTWICQSDHRPSQIYGKKAIRLQRKFVKEEGISPGGRPLRRVREENEVLCAEGV